MNRNINPKIPVIIMDLRLLKGQKKSQHQFLAFWWLTCWGHAFPATTGYGSTISGYDRKLFYPLTCHSTSLIRLYILQAIVGQRPWCWSFTYASPNQLTTFQTKNDNHEIRSNFYTRGKINLERHNVIMKSGHAYVNIMY